MQELLFEELKSKHYPTTRFQGSKRKLLPKLEEVFEKYSFNTAIDLFCGSGSVSYLLRTMSKNVIANDYLAYNANSALVLLSNYKKEELNEAKDLLSKLLVTKPTQEVGLVREKYKDIFFTEEENEQIDYFCANLITAKEKLRPVLIYSVGQALLKKRPFNLFHRANLATRTADVKRSFGNKKTWDTPIKEHANKAIDELKKLHLDTLPVGSILSRNTANLEKFPKQIDLVYMDPPYIPKKGSAIDYCDFYCFLDGLVNYDLFSNEHNDRAHKPILQMQSAWTNPITAITELKAIVRKWEKSVFVLSYRNDGALTVDQIEAIFKEVGREVRTEIISIYKYALAHSNETAEIVIISEPVN